MELKKHIKCVDTEKMMCLMHNVLGIMALSLHLLYQIKDNYIHCIKTISYENMQGAVNKSIEQKHNTLHIMIKENRHHKNNNKSTTIRHTREKNK